MGQVYTGFTERVRFTLSCEGYDSLVLANDPIGWNEDEKEIDRNKDYQGIYAKISNSLKFVKDGADYITMVYELDGIQAPLFLLKEEMHPKTDLWVQSYSGFLDLSTYEIENNQVGIKFNSGGLEEILRARDSDEFEIDRETALDGSAIPALEPKVVELDGRRIFLQSKWEVYPENRRVNIVCQDPGATSKAAGVPLTLTQKSHEEAQDVSPQTYSVNNVGEVGTFFFLESIENRQMRLYGKLKFLVEHVSGTETSNMLFSVCFDTYDSNYNSLTPLRRVLYTAPHEPALEGQVIEFEFDEIIDIDQLQSLSLEFILSGVQALLEQPRIVLNNIECTLNDDEDSFYEKTTSKFVLVHDIAQRLFHIITGKPNALYSEFYGRTEIGYTQNGNGCYTGATHGFWVRNFDKLPLSTKFNINPFKPLTTSVKEMMDSLVTIHNVGLGIESNGYSERIRIESLEFFYNRTVTIKLPNAVSNTKRYAATDKFYSSLEIGYDKGGVYEEAMGLDEYNAKSNFATYINRLVNKYIISSKWRADAYAKEFARRKQKFIFGTTDTSYDNDVMLMDLKPDTSGMFYKERKWQDDFSEEPTGTYDPASATNLRFSPMNLLLIRHSWVIAAGLIKYPAKLINYISSTANSRLTTKLRTDSGYLNDPTATPGNGKAYSESGNIINSDLKSPRYKAEILEFDHKVTFDIMEQVEGSTTVNDKLVYNKYGLVQIKHENGDIEEGFLLNLKPNGAGRWKILVFNK